MLIWEEISSLSSLINGKLKKGDRRGDLNRSFSLANPVSGVHIVADALGLIEHLLRFGVLLPGVALSDAEAPRLPIADDIG